MADYHTTKNEKIYHSNTAGNPNPKPWCFTCGHCYHERTANTPKDALRIPMAPFKVFCSTKCRNAYILAQGRDDEQ